MDTMADARRENVKRVTVLGMTSWICTAGQPRQPIGCDRHGARHYYCTVCRGWYGVPHDDIHSGPRAHPLRDLVQARGCVCVPCRYAVAHYPIDRGDPSYEGAHRLL